ncbi:GGDEF domain-containing protein [Anabaena subtropica]|uniref:GGDEF domain-containing protein n=1 Tax=Anabaena subtropica FACHB-260 TaxID=2692884 RepID=A0ABR8CNS5_9NOST|nr:GGDEF domain-containing protein [Anabaena subtropica]MBD2344826.1 GGDEF domain-containing protein [Anabaena subtropica FACHB-260]
MTMTILVFGSYDFLRKLPDQIHKRTTDNLVVLTDFHQAVSQIQIASPDVIFVQASLKGGIELCGWLKEQTQLSCIHCILVEDRPQQLAQRSQNGCEWEFEMTATALHQGADAYIWQLPTEEMATHRLILGQLTVGLRKAQKYRDLIEKNHILSAIALADSLTDLNNRRALEWDLPRQITKARNQNIPLSLVILDVDYFKKVNDQYGHLVGDRLLQLLCTRLRHNLRSQDTAFRYGGEEFVVLLPHTTAEEALIVADRLNRIVGEQPFSINSKLIISVTISLGVACLEADDDEKGIGLLHRADQCLLAAKASGRNRVICSHQLSQLSSLEAVS